MNEQTKTTIRRTFRLAAQLLSRTHKSVSSRLGLRRATGQPNLHPTTLTHLSQRFTAKKQTQIAAWPRHHTTVVLTVSLASQPLSKPTHTRITQQIFTSNPPCCLMSRVAESTGYPSALQRAPRTSFASKSVKISPHSPGYPPSRNNPKVSCPKRG